MKFKSSILAVMVLPFLAVLTISVLAKTPQLATANVTASVGDSCPHVKLIKEWHEWRKRNPDAHSRYADKNTNQKQKLEFAPTPEPDDMEPDPDSGFGGCGCPPDVAARTCGYFHSEVYGLKHSN